MKEVTVTCPECQTPMENRGKVRGADLSDGYYTGTYLWQCPKCKRVEIRVAAPEGD